MAKIIRIGDKSTILNAREEKEYHNSILDIIGSKTETEKDAWFSDKFGNLPVNVSKGLSVLINAVWVLARKK